MISARERTFPQYDDGFVNAVLIPLELMQLEIMEHRHLALQCVFVPPNFVDHQIYFPRK
jgi:hypothetical protein